MDYIKPFPARRGIAVNPAFVRMSFKDPPSFGNSFVLKVF
jgi:hypothetical protein